MHSYGEFKLFERSMGIVEQRDMGTQHTKSTDSKGDAEPGPRLDHTPAESASNACEQHNECDRGWNRWKVLPEIDICAIDRLQLRHGRLIC